MPHVFKPVEREKRIKIESTPEEREKDRQSFRAYKEERERIKNERFAKIKGNRKSGSGSGINVKVGKDIS